MPMGLGPSMRVVPRLSTATSAGVAVVAGVGSAFASSAVAFCG